MGLKMKNYDGAVTCAIGVNDMNKSIEWYKEVLGFELLFKGDEIGWCEFKTPVPGTTVGLSQVEKLEQGGGATLTWGVEDIDASKAELEKLDVKFDGEIQVIPDMVKLLTFFDPDGNTFMLAQDLTK